MNFLQNHLLVDKALVPQGKHKTVAGIDTVIESDTSKENKEPRYFYFPVNTAVFGNTEGSITKKSTDYQRQ